MTGVRRGSVFLGGVFGIGGRLSDPIVLAGADFRANVLPGGVTFTRASGATFFDSAGVLQEVGVDVPRFDYDPTALTPLGLLVEPSRTNLFTASRFGSVVTGVLGTGSVGVGGTGAVIFAAGLVFEILAAEIRRGVPGIVIRISGTATGGVGRWRIGSASQITTGGTTQQCIVYSQVDAGSWASSFGTAEFRVRGTASTGTITTEAPTTTFRRMAGVGVISAGIRGIEFNIATVDTTMVDVTFFIGGLQVEETPDPPTSLVLAPVSSPAATTRAADVASYAAPNGTYDELIQDTVGGEWRTGVTVTGGSRTITPIAGRFHVRRVRLFALGTATVHPEWAVAI